MPEKMSALKRLAEIENDVEKMANEDIRFLIQAFKVMEFSACNNWSYINPGGDYIPHNPWKEFESEMKNEWKGKIENWPNNCGHGYPHSLEEPFIESCSLCNPK